MHKKKEIKLSDLITAKDNIEPATLNKMRSEYEKLEEELGHTGESSDKINKIDKDDEGLDDFLRKADKYLS